jgi:HlyD family secretion protein
LSPKLKELTAVKQFQSETDAIREAPEPRFARMTVWVLTGLIVTSFAVMAVARIDRVVSGGGKIVPTRLLNVYQALDTSLIRSIDVREGQEVAKGQKLASLDPTFAAADVKQLKLQIAGLDTQIARDQAQLEDKPLVFPPSSDPDIVRYQTMNKSYYNQQVAQYKAETDSFDAKIKQLEATVQKYQADRDAYQQRSDIAKQIEDMRTVLAQHGSGSELNKLISQDQHLDLVRNLDYDNNSLAESKHTLASTQSDKQAFIQQWRMNLSQDLVSARSSLDTAQAQLEKAVKHQDLVQWTAEEPSIVLTVAKLSVGSVLKEGDPLLTLMPIDTPLEAEAQVASRDVGFVRVGDSCTLKIEAFNYMEHGTAEGRVRWISDDAFTTDDDGKPVDPYYKVRCSVDGTHFINVGPNFRLIPGMTLTTDMKVGTRSALAYVLGGVVRVFGESMREP